MTSPRTAVTALVPSALAMVVGLSGCGGGGAESVPPSGRVHPDAPLTPVTEVSDSAGIRVVLNRGPGLLETDGPLRLEETLRLGGLNADEPEQFFRISDVKIHEDGRVFVGNEQDGTIRVFGPDGSYLFRFGGLGEGPGEMGELDGVFFVGDTVAALDRGGRGPGETALFNSDGKFVGAFYDIRLPGASARISGIGPQGWIGTVNYFGNRGRRNDDDDDDAEPDTMRVEHRRIYLLDPHEQEIVDTLYTFPAEYEYRVEDGDFEEPLFEPVFGSGMDRRGNYYIGQSFPYRIHMYGPDGELGEIIEREVPIWPLGPGDVDVIRREIRTYYDTISEREPQWRRERTQRDLERLDERADLPLPEAQPITGRLLVSDDGSLWVERRDDLDPGVKEFERNGVGGGRRRSRPTYWDLFDAEHRFLGEVELPPRFEPMSVDGLELVGVTQDEYDLEYVVVLRAVLAPATQPQ